MICTDSQVMLFLLKPPSILTILRAIYSLGHSRSGTETLWRLFPISWDWKAELKKPSPGPLQNRAKNTSIWNLAKQAYKTIMHYQFVFTEGKWKKKGKKTKPDGLRRRLTGFALDAPLMLWITTDMWYTHSCKKLPRVRRTWEHKDVCLLAPLTIFGGVLLTNKLTHCQLRYNKVCPCGSWSLISTNRLEVKISWLNWKYNKFNFIFSLMVKCFINLIS